VSNQEFKHVSYLWDEQKAGAMAGDECKVDKPEYEAPKGAN
jgi:hypothetical protein